uniref:Small ribosomal subunit protein uS15 n=1 Tax=Salmo trutta TaxID=8032 RepID=A0A674AKX8_SALTR
MHLIISRGSKGPGNPWVLIRSSNHSAANVYYSPDTLRSEELGCLSKCSLNVCRFKIPTEAWHIYLNYGNLGGNSERTLARSCSTKPQWKSVLKQLTTQSPFSRVEVLSSSTAIMGRMHAPGKGLSQSALPYRRSVPTWLKLASDDVKEQIFKLAKKGLTPSQIGVILRDSHGVAQVRFVTGNKILRILKTKGLAPDLPEDLYHLIKKAVAVRKHLERNRKDKDAKFRLILTESRIHRLARYYKTRRVLAPNWKYESSTASALVA